MSSVSKSMQVAVWCIGAFALQPFSSAEAQGEDIVTAPPADDSASEQDELDAPSEALAPAGEKALLDAWIRYLAQSAKRGRLTTGASSLIGSSVLMGLGIAFYIQSPENEIDKGLGLTLIAFSGVGMSLGVVQLARKSAAERQLVRWEAASSPAMSARELARFEGELRMQVEIARRQLLSARWTSFGTAMGGALLLGLTPVADLSTDGATAGYITGGVLLGFGLLNFGMTFVKGSAPDYWEAYRQGRRPPAAPKNWGLAPAIGRGFAGARISGRF